MAVVPELTSEMMAYQSEESDLFFEVDGPTQMKGHFQDPGLCSWDDGIQLQISHQLFNKSLTHMVSLFVAVEKLRMTPVLGPQASQEDDLQTLFSFIFEEEYALQIPEALTCDPWDDDRYESDAIVRSLDCRLQDTQQKCIVLTDPCELKALHLNGENKNREVVFSMSFVQGGESNYKTPVALGLKGRHLYLSCVMKDEKPTLQLETVDPKQYPKKNMEKRFVFNKIEVQDKVEFESAQFPNWYISTSQAEHRSVFLGSSNGQDITDFTMEFV